jgi:hypothetical protein
MEGSANGAPAGLKIVESDRKRRIRIARQARKYRTTLNLIELADRGLRTPSLAHRLSITRTILCRYHYPEGRRQALSSSFSRDTSAVRRYTPPGLWQVSLRDGTIHISVPATVFAELAGSHAPDWPFRAPTIRLSPEPMAPDQRSDGLEWRYTWPDRVPVIDHGLR